MNYGYSILRSLVARALVSSGLLPALGIFHTNKYNPYCLADDIMEPYRPFVDQMVQQYMIDKFDLFELTPEIKKHLLIVPTVDVWMNDNRRPLMVAISQTTSSVADCFAGRRRRIDYPRMLKS